MRSLGKKSNACYKSFTSTPFLIQDVTKNSIEDHDLVLSQLQEEVHTITQIVEWSLQNDKNLLEDLENYTGYNNASKIGIALGITIPQGVIQHQQEDHYQYTHGEISQEEYLKRIGKNKGNSRREWLYHRRLTDEASSWLERVKALNGSSDKYISQGWKRTVSAGTPSDLKDKVSLSITDKQYAQITNDPFDKGIIILKIVINGSWYYLHFKFDHIRFSDGDKLCLPDITVNDKGKLVFNFSVEYKYIYKHISTEYFVSVDVNIDHYLTATVLNKEGEVVHATTLSRRVHELTNSVKATSKQITYLHKKRKQYAQWDQEYHVISQEIRQQRQKNSRKKEQLAIIAGQELAYLAYSWDNAVVCFEDLSWIKNTMQNGRWNRGELVKRTTEYVELNGSRVMKVDAKHTSTHCAHCNTELVFKTWKIAYCPTCDCLLDRDVNAAHNVGLRMISTVIKMSTTRRTGKKYQTDKDSTVLRTPVTQDTLSYNPLKNKKSRRKSAPTGKCDNKKRGRQFRHARKRFQEEVTISTSTATRNDDVTVLVDDKQYGYDQDPQKATIQEFMLLNDMHPMHPTHHLLT